MKKGVKFISIAGVLVLIGLSTGCMGGIRPFSSEHQHTHYETTPETDQRIKELWKKINQMEQDASDSAIVEGL
ncbi:MAG: hypothetical protein GXY61_08865 [Lentisphaerae bacterium]|jgi:hypothetical protein|nr:hypothetical protein [Lentisphaerota bacterium]